MADFEAILAGLEDTYSGLDAHGRFNLATLLHKAFLFGQPDFDPVTALDMYEEAACNATQVHSHAVDTACAELANRSTRVMLRIREAYSALCASHNLAGDKVDTSNMDAEDLILRFTRKETDKELPIQSVVRYILTWTKRLAVRHKGERVYCQIKTKDGRGTHAWVPAADYNGWDISSIESLVARVCTRRHNEDIWLVFLTLNNKQIHDKLRLCVEPEFPELRTVRAWIAFKDGLYSAHQDLFVPYDQMDENGIGSDLAACTYHKVDFAPCFMGGLAGDPRGPRCIPLHPLYENPTPLLNTILDDQKLCGHTKFWLMAMMGRCLYYADQKDSWQVSLFLKGRAQTGKSTLVNLMASLYEAQDVVVVPNNVEDKFGLMNLKQDTFLWIAPEVKTDFALDQATFQSLVSHERMSIPRKNQAPLDGIVLAHGALAGNTLPTRWCDNAGSIRRRLVVVHFGYQVKKVMGDLVTRIKTEELPAIIRKINFCYGYAVSMLDGQDLWQSGLLSPHILAQNLLLYESMNALRKFISEGHIEIDPGYFMPQEQFVQRYKAYVKNGDLTDSPWSADYAEVPLMDAGMHMRMAVYVWDGAPATRGKIILGGCFKDWKNCMAVAEGIDNPILEALSTSVGDPLRVVD